MPKTTDFFHDTVRVISWLWHKKGKGGGGRLSKFASWFGREMRRE